ncbi:ATP-binding protein [Flavobacterium phycosphaerae]|uniref:anticodon nuclease n=1 Tax=Flavobacterium phycosphaerae TaxID=2697515 RepID=UPI001389E285|nr:anticodon nuclease [Flavobacterium phycosphaerae]
MAQSLTATAQSLINANKKVQLIYAFNGIGKTRLSREFRLLVAPKQAEGEEESEEETGIKILYYNAFTEDLFYWDNDLDADVNRKLLIRPNGFTNLVLGFLKDQGLDENIATNFRHYTSDKLTPRFNEQYTIKDATDKEIVVPAYSEITFSIEAGNEEPIHNIKISKAEESNFIWCVFYSLLEQIVEIRNLEPEDRATLQFDDLEYVFIDDPVSSLDDNHLIQLAVNLADLIKKSRDLKFVVSTHNPLFYNVLFNEVGNKTCYMFTKLEDATYDLIEKHGDSNKSFSYHLFLKQTIEEAIIDNKIQKYHFMLLRNLYEKTANFLGYPKWSELLPDDKQTYYNRVIQFTSHSTLSNDVVPEPTEPEKQTVKFLLDHLVDNNYWKEAIVAAPAAQVPTTETEHGTV